MEAALYEPLKPEAIARVARAGLLGRKIHYLDAVDSTNAYAAGLAANGAGEGEIVIAESQTRGKGRLGRSWVSPPYMNLYLSVVLRPTLAPRAMPQVTLAAAVALAEGLERVAPLRPEIKWPNDLLVGGKKLAGILSESSCEAEGIRFVILGIGVNLNFPLQAMPEAIRDRATSLLILTGRPVDRSAFAGQLIQSLDRCYGELNSEGFSALAGRWESYFGLRARPCALTRRERPCAARPSGSTAAARCSWRPPTGRSTGWWPATWLRLREGERRPSEPVPAEA